MHLFGLILPKWLLMVVIPSFTLLQNILLFEYMDIIILQSMV